MIGVLVRLQWMTLRGRVLRSLRLLRQPKYLIGFVVGAAWMSLWILRPMLRAKFSMGAGIPIGAGHDAAIPDIVHWMAALFVTVFMPLSWLLPWGPLGLPFREAELTLLLQAPLSRRQIIQYGLLKSEVGIIVGAFFVSLAFGGRGWLAWLCGLASTWLLFDLWHVNSKWKALFNLRQREIAPAAARTRRAALTAGLLAFYALVFAAVVPFVARIVQSVRGDDFQEVAARLTGLEFPPLLRAVCAPGYWLTAPSFATGPGAFLLACVPLVATLLVQREIVLRSRARFEEVALEQAKEKETRKAPGRRFARVSSRARSTGPFTLGPLGDPAHAILWKNLLRVSRIPLRRAAMALPLVLVAVAVVPALLKMQGWFYGTAAAFGFAFLCFAPLGGGMFWNNDLRTELSHLELLRTWPVAARRLVQMEILAPAFNSFVASLAGALLVLASVLGSRLRELSAASEVNLAVVPREGLFGVSALTATILILVAALPLTAAVAILSSALQNLVTLFLPAWMAHSADRSQGIAAFGQRMISIWALALALFVALIPGALLVAAVVLLQRFLDIPLSAWEFPLWGVLAAAPVFLVTWPIVELAARLWERLDPAEELLEVGR